MLGLDIDTRLECADDEVLWRRVQADGPRSGLPWEVLKLTEEWDLVERDLGVYA